MATIEKLLEQLAGGDYYERSNAARSLGNFDDPQARQALLGALNDEDEWVVEYAIESLGRIGNPADAEPLSTMLEHSHYKIRTATATALGKLGNSDILPALEAHKDDSDSWVRDTVKEAIARLQQAGAPAPKSSMRVVETTQIERSQITLDDPHSMVERIASTLGAQFKDLGDGSVLLRLTLNSGRTQKVRVILDEKTSDGEGRIRLLTILGRATDKYIRWSLKQNLRISRGAIGLLKLRGVDYLALTEVVLFSETSEAFLEESIDRLARRGDRLESMLGDEDQW